MTVREIRLTQPENTIESGEDEHGKYRIYIYYTPRKNKSGEIHYNRKFHKVYLSESKNKFKSLEDNAEFQKLLDEYVNYCNEHDCSRGEGKLYKKNLRINLFKIGKSIKNDLTDLQIDKYIYRILKTSPIQNKSISNK